MNSTLKMKLLDEASDVVYRIDAFGETESNIKVDYEKLIRLVVQECMDVVGKGLGTTLTSNQKKIVDHFELN